MSERERWIVYPLLFFALGAAIRDKLLQRIETKEIYCESLRIVDQQDPNRILAELSFRRANSTDPTQLADREGRLRLIDSDGREVCELNRNLTVQRLATKQLLVIDPSGVPMINALAEPVPGMMLGEADSSVSYRGVIYLNNRPMGIRLAPPVAPPKQAPSPAPSPPLPAS
ncbi:MAG: hypothetical protein GXP26_08230 [Planctomycetes bacterium]|nr:hypothetical protein [Planctomycetota bacterium]